MKVTYLLFAQKLLNMAAKYGCTQTIARPTRINYHSATLIGPLLHSHYFKSCPKIYSACNNLKQT